MSKRFAFALSVVCLVNLILLCSAAVFARQKQSAGNKQIDSLLATVPSLMRSNVVQAQANISKIKELSAVQHYQKGIVDGAFDSCWMLYHIDELDKCIALIDQSLARIAGIYDQPLVIKFYILKGQCYVKRTQLNLAVEQFNIALKLSDKFKDDADKAGALLSIGWACMEHGKYDDAIGFFREIFKIKAANQYLNKSTVYNNIASCYNSLNKPTEAIPYALQGIAEAKRTNTRIDLANGLNILAAATYQQGKVKQALSYLNEASKVRETVGDPSMLAADYIELSDMYRKSGQFEPAITYAKKAAAIASQNKINLKIIDAFTALTNSLESKGDYREAVTYYKKLLAYKDSAGTVANNEAMADLLVKYQTQKKTTENLQLKQDNLKAKVTLINKQRWLTVSTAVAIVILIIFVFSYIYNRNRYKSRLALQQATEKQNRTRAILETEENERRRIAADLHDGVCQTLATISVQLKSPNRSMDSVQQLLDEATDEVRAAAHRITPELLKHLGLAKAIEISLERLNNSGSGTLFHFYELIETQAVDELLQVMIYRAFQELVNNIIKHARATEVNVHLSIDDENVTLLIEDNGVGFDTADSKPGLGLKNLANRVKVFNGLLTIDSMPQKGTTIIIKFDSPVFLDTAAT